MHLPAEEIWSSRLHETAVYTLGAAAGAHGSFHGCRRSLIDGLRRVLRRVT